MISMVLADLKLGEMFFDVCLSIYYSHGESPAFVTVQQLLDQPSGRDILFKI